MSVLKEIKGITILECDTVLRSGRVYPKEVIKKSIENDKALQERLALKGLFGGFNYTGPLFDMSTLAFVVEKLYFEGNELKIDISILDTAEGRVLADTINECKISLAYTAVGEGDLEDNRVVNYKLTGVGVYSKGVKNEDNN